MVEIDWRWFNWDNDGWFSLPVTGLGVVYLKASLVEGQWRITEIYIDGGDRPIDSKALRTFPLGVVEEEARDLAEFAVRLAGEFPEDVEYPKQGPDVRSLFTDLAPENAMWVPGNNPPPMPPREPLTLRYDPNEGLTDAFLIEVAKVYAWAIRERRPPATEMARQAGVAVRTAQSWIYKARKRGLMPPATRRGRIV